MLNDTNSVFQVPKRVNSISNSKIFGKNCDDIKTLVIHDNVNSINSKCLCTLKNLEKIEVADNNKCFSVIGGVLYNKKNNTLVKLPPKSEVSEVNISRDLVPFAFDEIQNNEKRLEISKTAFANCENIEYINFDKNIHIDTIFSEAFIGCKKLKKLFLPEQVYCIEYNALKGCELETLVLPDKMCNDKEEIRKILGFGSIDELKAIDIKKASEYLEEQRSSASNSLKSAGTENASKKINSNDDASYSDKGGIQKTVEVSDNGMEKQNYNNIKMEIPESDNVSKLEKQSAEKDSEKQNANPMNAAAISTSDLNIQSLIKMVEQKMPSKQTIDVKDVQIMLLKQQLAIQELQHQLEMQKRDNEIKIASLENEISELKREIRQKDNQIVTLSNANSGLKEKNKELSKQMSKYVSQHDSINPNYFYDLHKKTGKKIQSNLDMVNVAINMKNESLASFYLRLSAEYCLSEICSLYDLYTGEKATLEQMIELSEKVFEEHNMNNSFCILNMISMRCNPMCHSEKGEAILMDRSFSCEEAQACYDLLKNFYNSDFVTLCKQSNKLNDLSTKISKTETNNSKTELNFCDSQILNNPQTLNQELQSESFAGETINKASDNAKGGEINKIGQQQEAKQKIDSKRLFECIKKNVNEACENEKSQSNSSGKTNKSGIIVADLPEDASKYSPSSSSGLHVDDDENRNKNLSMNK